MKYSMLTGLLALTSAAPAFAASDYLLEIEGVKGESKATVSVESWSFGVCNPGSCASTKRTIVSPRDPASGQATGKRQHAPVASGTGQSPDASGRASWDLAKGKGARSAGGVNVAAGDLDGDGRADLAMVGGQSEISDFTLGFDKSSPVLAKVCGGKHIPQAVLTRRNGESYVLSEATVTCSADALTDGLLIVRYMTGSMKHTKTGHVTLLK